MPVSKRLYPSELSSELRLVPKGEPFDPENEHLSFEFLVREDQSDDTTQVLDLSGSDLSWTTLQINVLATLPSADLERVLPASSDVKANTELIVSVTCSATRMRLAQPLEYSEGGWHGSLLLRRQDARGAVRLTPRLVRSTEIPNENGTTGYATKRGVVLAEGRALTVQLDAQPLADGVLDVKWVDFPNAKDHEWLAQHGDDVYFLELQDTPTLFLNASHAELKAALNSKTDRGATAIVRYMGNAMIAQSVWLQLYHNAAAALPDQEGDGDDLESLSGWRKPVLKSFLSRAFPGQEESEQIRRLRELNSEGREALFFAQLSSAAQDAAKSMKQVKLASRAAATIKEDTNQ